MSKIHIVDKNQTPLKPTVGDYACKMSQNAPSCPGSRSKKETNTGLSKGSSTAPGVQIRPAITIAMQASYPVRKGLTPAAAAESNLENQAP
jgi:hypothetical protein